MTKTSVDDLAGYLSLLVLRGATEVALEFEAGFTVLRWKFLGQPPGCLPLELEESCFG